jgi:hypothetical protein
VTLHRLVEGYRLYCTMCKTEGTPMQEIDNDHNTGLTKKILFRCFNCNNVLKIVEM